MTLLNCAAMDFTGEVVLNVEPSGRYSGIGLATGTPRSVRSLDINDIVSMTVEQHGQIDLLKVDVEGAEGPILRGITDSALGSVRHIAVEGRDIPIGRLIAAGFSSIRHRSGVYWFCRPDLSRSDDAATKS